MKDQVEKPVVQARFDRLVEAQGRISLERNRTLVGTDVELTMEKGASKRNPGRSSGRTRTNKVVHIDTDDVRPGDVVRAHVTDARSHYLIGVPA
jgi:tRNA-2-methylthio-N6-dimethylallyladenosine synthase